MNVPELILFIPERTQTKTQPSRVLVSSSHPSIVSDDLEVSVKWKGREPDAPLQSELYNESAIELGG